jgi:endonuclease YncB( thermonuclease family)
MAFPKPAFCQRSVSAATIVLCLLSAQATAAENAAPGCRFEPLGAAKAVAIADGRSIRLADGREIRLAGIDVPQATGGNAASAAALASKTALKNLVLGKEVVLTAPSDTADRYGRVAAFAFVNGSETPVQYNLLARGQARVSAHVTDNDCSRALFGEEKKAREAGIGLWGDPGYAVRAAADGPAIRSQQGRFSVIEGRVVSVRDTGGMIYVNFGRRWPEALTVIILKRHEGSFAAAGVTPRTLEGRMVRIRGYVDVRSGPVIEATRPQQIEVAAR